MALDIRRDFCILEAKAGGSFEFKDILCSVLKKMKKFLSSYHPP